MREPPISVYLWYMTHIHCADKISHGCISNTIKPIISIYCLNWLFVTHHKKYTSNLMMATKIWRTNQDLNRNDQRFQAPRDIGT